VKAFYKGAKGLIHDLLQAQQKIKPDKMRLRRAGPASHWCLAAQSSNNFSAVAQAQIDVQHMNLLQIWFAFWVQNFVTSTSQSMVLQQ